MSNDEGRPTPKPELSRPPTKGVNTQPILVFLFDPSKRSQTCQLKLMGTSIYSLFHPILRQLLHLPRVGVFIFASSRTFPFRVFCFVCSLLLIPFHLLHWRQLPFRLIIILLKEIIASNSISSKVGRMKTVFSDAFEFKNLPCATSMHHGMY